MPAYSMGKEKKQPSFIRKNESPGVGAYQSENWKQNSKMKNSGSAAMTKARRFLKPAEDNVGPGAYNPEKPTQRLSASIKGKYNSCSKLNTPSPASYSPQIQFPKKEYSFTKDGRKFQLPDGPGPAQYSLVNSRIKTGPIFGKEDKMKTLDSELKPGPGEYQKNEEALDQRKNMFSFSRQKKFQEDEQYEKIKKQIPGPGSYDIIKFKKRFRGGKFTQAQRDSLVSSNNLTPSPLTYNPTQSTLRHNPQPTIGLSLRMRNKTEENPGPGSYSIPDSDVWKTSTGKIKFTKNQRIKTDLSQTPGPGTYDLKTSEREKEKGFSMTASHFHIKTEENPGPQNYKPNYDSVVKSAGRVKFGNDERIRKLKTETPGPGNYERKEKNFCKTFYFDRSKKKQDMNKTVGPGAYKIKPYFGQYDGLEKQEKDILYV